MATPDKAPKHNRGIRIVAGAVAAVALAGLGYRASQGGATSESKSPAVLSTEQLAAQHTVGPKLTEFGGQLATAYDQHKPGTSATKIPGTGNEYVVFAHQATGDNAVEGIMTGSVAKTGGKPHLTLNSNQTSLIS